MKGDKSKAFFAEEDRPEKEVVCTLRCPLLNQTGLCKHRRIIIIFQMPESIGSVSSMRGYESDSGTYSCPFP